MVKEVKHIPGLTSNEEFFMAAMVRAIDSCEEIPEKEMAETSRIGRLLTRVGHEAYKTIPPIQKRRMSREDNIYWNKGVQQGVLYFLISSTPKHRQDQTANTEE